MQLALIIGILFIASLLVMVAYKIGNPELSKLNQYEREGLERLEKIISSVGPIEKIKFFTDGHPYVWVEASYEEIKNKVRLSCTSPYPGGGGGIPASFKEKTDIENGFVYIVVEHGKEFNWASLQHYEEWLKSNEPFAEKIAAFKEKS